MLDVLGSVLFPCGGFNILKCFILPCSVSIRAYVHTHCDLSTVTSYSIVMELVNARVGVGGGQFRPNSAEVRKLKMRIRSHYHPAEGAKCFIKYSFYFHYFLMILI